MISRYISIDDYFSNKDLLYLKETDIEYFEKVRTRGNFQRYRMAVLNNDLERINLLKCPESENTVFQEALYACDQDIVLRIISDKLIDTFFDLLTEKAIALNWKNVIKLIEKSILDRHSPTCRKNFC